MKCQGQIISKGIAVGKAKFLSFEENETRFSKTTNQLDEFKKAIEIATENIEKKINDAKKNFNERISDIFLSHKFIINDPLIIEKTVQQIDSGKNAYLAYDNAVTKILSEFQKIENEYMLGRIVDIIDATDIVKTALKGKEKNIFENYDSDTIAVLKDLKPSVIYSLLESNVCGFISDTGSYFQHSGMIARAANKPGIVCPNFSEKAKENDLIILDCVCGDIHINPDKKTIEKYLGGAK